MGCPIGNGNSYSFLPDRIKSVANPVCSEPGRAMPYSNSTLLVLLRWLPRSLLMELLAT